jgi:hypothetical protein
MKRSNLVMSVVLLLTVILAACTISRKVSYSTIKTEIITNTGLTFSVATHDQRKEVSEQFVGYFRSGPGIPYNLGTASLANFSDDFSTVIKNSLKESTNQTKIISTNSSDSKQKILNNLIDSKSDRLLLFTITKWRTDSKPMGLLYGTEVIWNISLEIFNNKGELLASNHTEGIDPETDRKMSGSIEKIQKKVNEKFKEKIDLLFNDPKIKEVLSAK